MNEEQLILHVDLNSFFATASQLANPALRGKPVGIIKAKERTCIIAASVEAKRYGVTTGCRVKDARRLCPQIILVPADFDKYEDISYRFIDICKRYSPICEVFSLDECFLDVAESEKLWPRPPRNASIEHLAWFEMGKKLRDNAGGGNVFNIAFDIKEKLKVEIGEWMTCSIGISYNRLLAKLASNQIKPDGLFWITADNVLKILDKSDLMEVCGLGWGLYNHLIKIGIDNFVKLRACSLEFLHKHFGPFWSVHLYNISRGIDNSTVVPCGQIADAKSVGRTYTAHKVLKEKSEVFKLVRNLCEEATFKARKMGFCGRYVGLMLRGNHENWYGHRTLKSYIDDGRKMYNLCLLIAKSWQVADVIFCGVTLAMLTRRDYMPISLYASDQKSEKLTTVEDRINNRFGDYTIFPARLLGMDIIRPEVTGYFGDKKYRLDFANQT